jgi:glutamate dehydrogenase
MATQEGKNAVIVPKGAKGGFIINKESTQISSFEFEDYYKRFINSLLDLVDNKIDSKVVRDSKIIAYDEDDSYFVVAADKGTSGMSDIANTISKERHYWISDAFASGSSNGYHHKKLGITAKGAIRSTQRFFIQKGVDFYSKSIDVVGVGSMSGDVFGNGMLQSKYFRLIAAISHNEIFIDPNPNLEDAYEERKKLFSSKRGKWSVYDKSKISKGGGVFSRDSKTIILSDEIKALLKSDKTSLSAEELIRELLKLQVDMLYFGGIGTYIKSSQESNIDIGDKENEFVRVDASDIKAFCICEGANLALSMNGRIEYALNGGNINLDSIDNSAGVDTSDHEVNLKIVLNSLVEKGTVLEKQKDEVLKTLSDFVVNSVLWTNYLQSLSISLDAIRSKTKIKKFKKSIFVLENNLEVFKRHYFNIPKDHDFEYVVDDNSQIIRPVLATLTLYAKIFLQDLLNSSSIYEDDIFFERYLFKYFPKSFSAIYEDEIISHPLKKEIISMVVANKIINHAGVLFVSDFYELKREKFLEKIRIYLVMNQLLEANDIRYEIYRKDYELNVLKQYSLLMKIEKKIEFNLRFFGKNFTLLDHNISSVLEYKDSIKHSIKLYRKKSDLKKDEDSIRVFFRNLDYMKYSSVIIKIKNITQFSIEEISFMLFDFLDELRVDMLLEIIEKITPSNSNEETLQMQMSELIEQFLVQIIKKILHFKRAGEDEKFCIDDYMEKRGFDLSMHQHLVEEYKIKENQSKEELLVLLNSILLLNESV